MKYTIKTAGFAALCSICLVFTACADEATEQESSGAATEAEVSVQQKALVPEPASGKKDVKVHTSRSRASIEEEMDETGFILEALKGEMATEEQKRAGFEKKANRPAFQDSLNALDRRLKLMQADVDKELKRLNRLQQELAKAQ
jgi:hypothetical protein